MKTLTAIERQSASEKAAKYFGNGFHCAEAVAASVLEVLGEEPSEATAHATAFGGGFGRTYQEVCGALSGALIAIGHLYGRRELGDEWDLPAKLGAVIRQRFLHRFGTTHCATLRLRFGEEQQMSQCRELTKTITNDLLVLLHEDSVQNQAWCCGCPPSIPESA
jgi:C_GCAxxG_C_C family probable redox protein